MNIRSSGARSGLFSKSLILLLGIPIAAMGQAPNETQLEFTRSEHAAGIAPYTVVLADLNGDGLLDVVVTNCSINHPRKGNTVTVLLATGPDSFSPVGYPTDTDPTYAVVADFNGDGVPDIATSNGRSPSSSVSVLIGNGDGTFQPHVDYELGQPWSNKIAAGDLNGDHVLDLVVTNYTNATMSVLLGNGDGTFQAPVTTSTTVASAGAVLADFNRDGNLDLAVTSVNGERVGIFLGNGDGTFQPRVDFPSGNNPIGLVAEDFNGDGIADLLVVNNCSDEERPCFHFLPGAISILIGNGDGTFQPWVHYFAGKAPWFAATGDFNGDGYLDVAVTNVLEDRVSVHLGNGDGRFQPTPIFFDVGYNPLGVAAGNMSGGSGPPDIVVTDLGGYNGKEVTLLRNSGSIPH